MKLNQNFKYNGLEYKFTFEQSDPSELWCIDEIVTNNDYILDQFVNQKNKVFVDIGANCGVATIILAKQNPESIVYSFEPDKNVFEIVKLNVENNNLKNVRLFNMAITNNDINTLTLCQHPRYSGGNTTYSNVNELKQFFSSNITHYDVECTSIDRLMSKYNIDEIELLKIDCEGAEYDIIFGSENIKQGKIRNMVGEFHNLRYNKVTHSAEELLTYSKQYIPNIKVSILNV